MSGLILHVLHFEICEYIYVEFVKWRTDFMPWLLQGDILEDPANEPEKDMFVMTVDPEDAPDTPE